MRIKETKRINKPIIVGMPLQISRNRDVNFEPVVVPKHKRDISDIEDKVISLYARGISTRDIHD